MMKAMIKTIRFLGGVIMFLARTIEVLSNVLKFMVFMSVVIGLFIGCFIGIMDLIHPTEYISLPLWLNILAVVVGGGCIWLASDKLRAEDRAHNEKMSELRNNTWLDE
jgi:hypothetical protein